MIEFKHVYKTYNKSIDVLKDVNFNINNGEYVCIIGRSGAGKSTIAKLLTAEEKVTKGQIIIDGWDITKISKKDIPSLRRQVATIFQDFRLLQKKTARENISFACEICGDFGDKMQKKIEQLLQVVGLSNKGENYPSELSGGEQQRVAIARALAFNPSILIADEPTGNLDTINTKGILTLLGDINNMGTTIILISHDKEVVNNLNKRIITLEDGVVVSDKENGSYII